MKVWLNGRILDAKKAHLSIFDHGFLYGDGIYETVRYCDGEVMFWSAHYKRFKKAARELFFTVPWSRPALAQALHAVAKANGSVPMSLRLTLTRGAGPLGLDPTVCAKPTVVIQPHPSRPLDSWREKGISLGILRMPAPVRHNPFWKSTSMQPLVQARLAAKRLNVFEGLLLNAQGEISEGTVSNLFFVRQRVLCTPALSCGLLPGVMRSHVLKVAHRLKIRTQEGHYRPQVLEKAQEIFITNASFGIVPVATLKIDRRKATFHLAHALSITRQLQAAIRASYRVL